MTNKKLHPSVVKFKAFVKSNPEIIKEVRKGNTTWQEVFEDWYLLGEEDSRWDTIKKEKKESSASSDKKSDWFSQVMGMVKNMDINQVQNNIHHLSQALSAIQGVIGQFQTDQTTQPKSQNEQPHHPFSFRKD